MKKLILSLLTLFFSVVMFAQGGIVKGTVTDSKGDPVQGVSILEVGTRNGVVSDFDGNFSLQLLKEQADIVFAFVGFEPTQISVEVPAGTILELQVTLLEDIPELDEL